MQQSYVKIDVLLVISINIWCCQGLVKSTGLPNYYWREFNGIIPFDAVPVAVDGNNVTHYIGQAFDKQAGNLPGVLHSGTSFMGIPYKGARMANKFIKILCSPNLSAFKWIPTSDTQFMALTRNMFPVIGGHEQDFIVNVGRKEFLGEVFVGKIVTASKIYPRTAPMFYTRGHKEKMALCFDALIYDASKF